MKNDPIILTLFFSEGISFKHWSEKGILTREIALYQKMESEGIITQYVTYGDRKDYEFVPLLNPQRVYSNSWGLSKSLYRKWLPFIHAKALFSSDIYKTNQMDGADVARRSARIWRRPWIARGGYLWSSFVAQKRGEGSESHREAVKIENRAWESASRIYVTTSLMRQQIADRLPNVLHKIDVQANYVNTEQFKPLDCHKKWDCVYLGRLTEQKNLKVLLRVIENLGLSILIIGDGELQGSLRELFAHYAKIEWIGNVSHDRLPLLLQEAKFFVFPTLYEGHPKALIEAMSCGMTVLASDVEGNRDLIHDHVNGRLCSTSEIEIQNVLRSMLGNPEENISMGQNARKTVLNNFSLESLVKREASLIRSLAGK